MDKAKASEIAREQVATMSKNVAAVSEIRRGLENKNHAQNRSKNQTSDRNSGNNRNNNSNNNNYNSQQKKPHGQNAQRGDRNNNNSNARTNTNNGESFNCRRCGYTHRARECPAYGKTCTKCSKPNHFSRACRAKDVSSILINNQNNTNETNNDEFYVGCIDRETETEDANQNGTRWIEYVCVNGRNIAFKVDTGAETDVLPTSVCEKIGVTNFERSSITLRAFGGQRIQTKGTCSLRCIFNNESLIVKFAVVDLNTMPILGLQTCRRLKIVTRNNERPL